MDANTLPGKGSVDATEGIDGRNSWTSRLIWLAIFTAASSLVFIFGTSSIERFPTNGNLIYQAGLAVGFLILALLARRSRKLEAYWLAAFAFFIAASVDVCLSLFAGRMLDWIMAQFYIQEPLVSALAERSIVALLTLIPILILTRMTRQKPGSIFLQRDHTRLWWAVGLVTLVLAAVITVWIGYRQGASPGSLLIGLPVLLLGTLSLALQEELWFRGIFLNHFSPLLGRGLSRLPTTLAVSVPYIWMLGETQVFVALIIVGLGILLCYLMQQSDSLWAAVFTQAAAVTLFLSLTQPVPYPLPPLPPLQAQTNPPALQEGALPFIIDTDMAADDWMAILYLLQHPQVDVKAITVTGAGEAHCQQGVRNALDLVYLAGRPEIPVACGRETPLEGDLAFPDDWRKNVDRMLGLKLPQNPNPPYSGSAVQLLTQTLQESPENVVLLTLGPLTNIAEAFQAAPGLVEKLSKLIIMGGAVSVPGNVVTEDSRYLAEWNIYVDPSAANVVLRSGAPVILVPLDATNRAPATERFYLKLGDQRTTPPAEFVHRVLGKKLQDLRAGWYYFWDPLAASLATNPELGHTKAAPILVDESGAEIGRTRLVSDGPQVEYYTTVDASDFEQLFLQVLNRNTP